jgi:hypothetical protein
MRDRRIHFRRVVLQYVLVPPCRPITRSEHGAGLHDIGRDAL